MLQTNGAPLLKSLALRAATLPRPARTAAAALGCARQPVLEPGRPRPRPTPERA
jgi:hypothetical protein